MKLPSYSQLNFKGRAFSFVKKKKPSDFLLTDVKCILHILLINQGWNVCPAVKPGAKYQKNYVAINTRNNQLYNDLSRYELKWSRMEDYEKFAPLWFCLKADEHEGLQMKIVKGRKYTFSEMFEVTSHYKDRVNLKRTRTEK